MNLTNLAVSALVANSVSNNVAGLPLRDFLFAGTGLSGTREDGYTSGVDWNNVVTLKEIFSGGQLHTTRGDGTIGTTLSDNLKANIVPLAIAVIGIPIMAKVATKALRKPIILPLNRMLKGMDVKI